MENQNVHLPIKEMERRLKGVIIRLPVIAGNEVVNFALDNFKRQAWLGDIIQPWRPRKNPNKWGQSPKRNGRAILIDSGRLRRSIRVIRTTTDSVVVGTDVPYARAHNEGMRLGIIQQVKGHERKVTKLGIVKTVSRKRSTGITFGRMQTGSQTVKAHTRRINQHVPQRRFLGNSQFLNRRLQRAALAEIIKALNNR